MAFAIAWAGSRLVEKTPETQKAGAPEVAKDTPLASGVVTPTRSSSSDQAEKLASEARSGVRAESAGLARLIHEVREKIPSLPGPSDMTAEQAHQTPPQVLEAGAALGDLEEHLDQNPGDLGSVIPFYLECAENTKTFPAVRAVCLHALKKRGVGLISPTDQKRIAALPERRIESEL